MSDGATMLLKNMLVVCTCHILGTTTAATEREEED